MTSFAMMLCCKRNRSRIFFRSFVRKWKKNSQFEISWRNFPLQFSLISSFSWAFLVLFMFFCSLRLLVEGKWFTWEFQEKLWRRFRAISFLVVALEGKYFNNFIKVKNENWGKIGWRKYEIKLKMVLHGARVSLKDIFWIHFFCLDFFTFHRCCLS